MVGLSDLARGAFASEAHGVSANGSVVIGSSTSASGGEAFRLTSDGGIVSLKDDLLAHGVATLTGWTLFEAGGVSADGKTIVGYGRNPQLQHEAWIATVPEPSSFVLAALGLIGLVVWRRQKR